MNVSPWQMLADYQDVTLVWTTDDAILKGSRGRWFPRSRHIALDATLTRVAARCSLMHEMAHAVLEHPASCDNAFYDYRMELEADRFAARVLLPDVDELATELAVSSSIRQAARNLRVITDLLEVRLSDLTEHEHKHIHRKVNALAESAGL